MSTEPRTVTFKDMFGQDTSLPEDRYNKLTETGALTERQMLDAKIDGVSLQDILNEANQTVEPDTGHLPGCSFGRTARCNCTYLQQWQEDSQRQDEIEHDTITFLRSPELQKLWEENDARLNPEPVGDRFLRPDQQHAGLPVVITTEPNVDPVALAEKIVKDNPDLFGTQPEGIYQRGGHTGADHARKKTYDELRADDLDTRNRELWLQLRSARRWTTVWVGAFALQAAVFAGRTLGWW